MIVLVFLLPFYSLAANQDFQNLLMGDPPQNEDYLPPNYQEYIDKLLDKMHKIHELTRNKLLTASNHQKKNYDHRKKMKLILKGGELYFFKIQPKEREYPKTTSS